MPIPKLTKREDGIGQDPRKRWWVDAVVRGRRIRKMIGAKSDARDYLQRERENARMDELFPERAKARAANITIEELVERYAEENRSNNRTWKNNEAYGRKWVEFLGADTLIAEIGPPQVEQFKTAELRRGVAAATINRPIERLKKLFNLAVRDGLLQQSPVATATKLKQPPGRLRFLEVWEEEILRPELSPRDWRVVEIAFLTGIRRERFFTALKAQVRLESGVFQVPDSKSGKRRDIPIEKRLDRVLREHLRENPKTKWLFPNPSGTNHWEPNNFYHRRFKPACARAGIEGLTWHDLRRTFGSRLAMSGARLIQIKDLMGHASINSTMIYAHLQPDHLRAAVEMMDLKFRG